MRPRNVATLLFIATCLLANSILPASAQNIYMTPITVVERGGVDLYNYAVRIELNSTNFDGWSHVQPDLSDVFFLDENRKPLHYWIEYANKTEEKAVIWVKIPHIPANSKTTIHMYYGGPNPYKAYNNPDKVFPLYDDFTYKDEDKWNWNSDWTVENGYLHQTKSYGWGNMLWSAYDMGVEVTSSVGIVIEAYAKNLGTHDAYDMSIAWDTDMSGSYARVNVAIGSYDVWNWFGSTYGRGNWGEPDTRQWNLYQVVIFDGKQKFLMNGKTYSTLNKPINHIARIGVTSKGKSYWDWIRVRPYTEPEPEAVVGSTVAIPVIGLPSETLIYQHDIVYFLSSSHFSYTFTATDTASAGYEASGYGWRVYVEPGGGENRASLIATASIELPYGGALVENIVFYARANGTGSFRQLWVKVLDDQGNTIAELKNTTINTEWTEVVVDVGKKLPMLKLWVNCTVSSTGTGEEVAVRDVRVYVRYSVKVGAYALKVLDKPGIPVFTWVKVELASSELVSSSVVALKVVDRLKLNKTSYPVEPLFAGYEVVDGMRYAVYVLEPARDTGVFWVNLSMPNALQGMAVRSKGVQVDTCLVNETVELYLPETAIVTVKELGVVFANASRLYLRFDKPGTYTISGVVFKPSEWKLGSKNITLKVVYGRLNIEPVDIDGKTLDYEPLTVQLVDSNGRVVGVATATGKAVFEGLASGNYTAKIEFKGDVVAEKHVELTVHTHNSTITVAVPAKRLSPDYRGTEKHVIVSGDAQLVEVADASPGFKYSRVNITLKGTGSFKLFIGYGSTTPAKVVVEGNATSLEHSWDEGYLVVKGSINGTATISTADLYLLKIELCDRLGRTLPGKPTITVNGTVFEGPAVHLHLHPGHYSIEVPTSIDGFKFHQYSDGYSENTRTITVTDRDIVLKAWYKVPTEIAEIRGYRMFALWHMLPLLFGKDGGKAKVYIEGYLRDSYGEGVPEKTIVIDIIDTKTKQTLAITVTTNATGYFKTPLIELSKDTEYIVHIIFSGDDTYLASDKTVELKLEELPLALPPLETIANNTIIPAITAITIICTLALATKKAIHIATTAKRFVKKTNKLQHNTDHSR